MPTQFHNTVPNGRIVVGKYEGKKPTGRRWRWCEYNIQKHLNGIGWENVDWTDLTQDRDRLRAFVNMVMNLRVLQNVGNFSTSWGTKSFSKTTLLHGVSAKGQNSITVNDMLCSIHKEVVAAYSKIRMQSRC